MRKSPVRARATGLILGTLAVGSLITWMLITGIGQGQQKPVGSETDHAAIQQARGLSRAFRSAAKQVLPTVVKIKTVTKPRQIRGGPSGENPFRGTPFEDFFDDELPGFSWRRMPSVPQPGLGSGVIIDSSGIVLTSNHVVAGADEVVVQLGDGRQFDVEDIKNDERTDLAVLRLKVDGSLPAARFGDSDQLEIGDWVLAIGHPFELQQSVSAGIISGKGRTLAAASRARFLQTDAAINPGNSGGPLVNLNGEVVGINTAIASRTGGYQGIGFAIPVNLAKWVTNQLIERGSVTRAYLGVVIENVTSEKADELHLPPKSGVLVTAVGDDSPAKKAGIGENDLIRSFDGHPIQNVSDLQELVERSQADSRHKIEILRDGKPLTLQVRVEAMPEDLEASFGPRGTSEFYEDRRLGLVVIHSDDMARRLGYRDPQGVLIMHVDPDQIAAQAGLGEGMLIVRVGKTRVGSVAEFREAIEKESLQEGITLEVRTPQGVRVFRLQSS
jgi:serine protease Do